ncbi:tRNA lysidine(34) synthetase TilS [Fulvivirga sp. 29W222]|uniref:tRNA(Ile)-lysidine synthase n=1 Tax=Fulvivirga marina TaxID=2494733 RepID=A0A937FXT8_9BACT|nr:tRNA lysidine(34) synthetase TilS [Fulvivirga marina]MBL6444911.1 tRNA lysidine(34) synthetase TilS [Fulvivirga marina]
MLLAVSGGVDSVVLVRLFKDAGFNFAIAHCNFQLRGLESDGDEVFVRELAQLNNVSCFVQSFDTKNYAALQGVSTQMAARDLRYGWFSDLMAEHNFKYIATAHHLDDSLETVLFNLTKGTGIAGLRGILPKKNNLIRPLLFASKENILSFARQKGLQWREDSSNQSTKYSRNLIRHEVIPALKKINPSMVTTFMQVSQRLEGTEKVLQQRVDQLRRESLTEQGEDLYLLKEKIAEQPAVVIEELLKPYGYNWQQVQEILNGLEGLVGKMFLSGSYQLNIDRSHLIISPLKKGEIGEQYIEINEEYVDNEVVKLRCYYSGEPKNFLKQKHEASLDFDCLKFPLKLRKWVEGDAFRPLGMRGKKKISDFMIDEKIPLNLKERVCVIESAGEVVWVVGHRVDDRFKVRPDTKRIFNMVMLQND